MDGIDCKCVFPRVIYSFVANIQTQFIQFQIEYNFRLVEKFRSFCNVISGPLFFFKTDKLSGQWKMEYRKIKKNQSL